MKHHFSRIEQDVHDYLVDLYGQENVHAEYYKDPRYPWRCDFYISSLDVFIEIQGHWSHGSHPYNENDSNDIAKLNAWISRGLENERYENAIHTWTISDVEKRDAASSNKLKYFEFFGTSFDRFCKEFQNFLENLENTDK